MMRLLESLFRSHKWSTARCVLTGLLALLGLLCTPSTQALEASVDRALVSEGDSLTLTIRRDGLDSSDEPDYLPLEEDFHLFGSRQSSRSVISNGRAEAWTEWQITLIPKRNGQLTIPSISVGHAQTAPIQIDVRPAQAQNSADQQRDPVFIEVSVDRDTVYVEQQLLLTVRVFHALALEDMQLSDPEPEQARVTKVAQTNFRRDIAGVTYQVHELVYAIFAEQPGELVIPELVFSGRQPLRSRSFFDFPGQGRSLRRMSRPLSVAIKPIPAEFSGATWLPARNLTLVESWNGNPERLAVGESMTRSLTLQADGVDAAHLPELAQPSIEGGRLYADQPQLNDSNDASGIRGKRVQSAALIPNRAGQLQLQGTRLVWWDVDSDSEKVAEIAPRKLQIRPALNDVTASTKADASSVESAITSGTSVAGTTASASQLQLWQLATALLTVGWAATLLWIWRQRRVVETSPDQVLDNRSATEKEAYRQLQRACNQQQPAAARSALLGWGAALLGREQISLEELLHWADERALARAVTELEQHLYGARTSTEWRGETLRETVDDVRKKKRQLSRATQSGNTALPSLYP